MNRRECLRTLGAALAARSGSAAATRPPNIIFILTDDLGWAELGCYGNRFNETPNLDALAAGGVRFTDAYAAAPVCSPTRASIMTGLAPARVGILDYLRADDSKFLSPSYDTLPETMARAGCHCGIIGKWHLMGDYQARKGDPKLHGFDESICSESSYIGPGYYFPPYKHMMEVAPRTPNEYLTDRLNQEAVEFIERHRERPFFLYLSHYTVHTRLAGKPELVEKYAAKPGAGKNRNNPELAAMLESLDAGVGLIRAALRRLALESNSIVVFTSDNGGEDRVTSNAPLRGGKSSLYEGGIRVPLIMAGPGVGKAGSVCRTPVVSTDFHPSFAGFAGVSLPEGFRPDGASLREAIRGTPDMLERPICWHYPLDKPHFLGGRSSGAIRKGRWKLIDFYDDGHQELYDLAADPGEKADLSATQPARKAEMLALFRKWRADVDATPKRW